MKTKINTKKIREKNQQQKCCKKFQECTAFPLKSPGGFLYFLPF